MADERKRAGPELAGIKVKMVANPLPVEEIYIDGFAGLMARGGGVKLDLYRVVRTDPESWTEHRPASHRPVLPPGGAAGALPSAAIDAHRLEPPAALLSLGDHGTMASTD